jgi:molybdopterin/thiamine biosynthesis adenylyltransferase
MHIFQVGAGSGGMVVLDLISRDSGVRRVTLIEPDLYQPHNVYRHVFPPAAVGKFKAELAKEWVRDRRPDVIMDVFLADLTDPTYQSEFLRLAQDCTVGVCAVDNEPAKYAFDALMRTVRKPWTLGEVLSGGIGGWVHTLTPDGACYGCIASYLKRTTFEETVAPPPNYAHPDSAIPETTVPASKASIEAIASLHAISTLRLAQLYLGQREKSFENSFTSLVFTLQQVPGVFEEPFRSYRFLIPRSPSCLICSLTPGSPAKETLDEALDQALARLGPQ